MNKMLLFLKIRKFYNSFRFVVGDNHITNIFKMTTDNVYDVLFDINEVLDGYYAFDLKEDEWTTWLKALKCQISKFCDKSPITLNSVLFHICNTKKNGFYEFRKGTKPIYKLAQWLYKKGVI